MFYWHSDSANLMKARSLFMCYCPQSIQSTTGCHIKVGVFSSLSQKLESLSKIQDVFSFLLAVASLIFSKALRTFPSINSPN